MFLLQNARKHMHMVFLEANIIQAKMQSILFEFPFRPSEIVSLAFGARTLRLISKSIANKSEEHSKLHSGTMRCALLCVILFIIKSILRAQVDACVLSVDKIGFPYEIIQTAHLNYNIYDKYIEFSTQLFIFFVDVIYVHGN